jgi:hypothetical protein
MSHVTALAGQLQKKLSNEELRDNLKIFTRSYGAHFAPWEYSPYGEIPVDVRDGIIHIDCSKAKSPDYAHQRIWHDLYLSGISILPRDPQDGTPLYEIRVDTSQEGFAENLTAAVLKKQVGAHFQFLAEGYSVVPWENDPVWGQNYNPHVEFVKQRGVKNAPLEKILDDYGIAYEIKEQVKGYPRIIVRVDPDDIIGKKNLQNLVKAVKEYPQLRAKQREQELFQTISQGDQTPMDVPYARERVIDQLAKEETEKRDALIPQIGVGLGLESKSLSPAA